MLSRSPTKKERRALADLAAGRDYGIGDDVKERLVSMGLLEGLRYPSLTERGKAALQGRYPSLTERGKAALQGCMHLLWVVALVGCEDPFSVLELSDASDAPTELAVAGDAALLEHIETSDAGDASDASTERTPAIDACCDIPPLADVALPDVALDALEQSDAAEEAPPDAQEPDAGEVSDACPAMICCCTLGAITGCRCDVPGATDLMFLDCIQTSGVVCGFGCTMGGACENGQDIQGTICAYPGPCPN